jgi:hypothetical protein
MIGQLPYHVMDSPCHLDGQVRFKMCCSLETEKSNNQGLRLSMIWGDIASEVPPSYSFEIVAVQRLWLISPVHEREWLPLILFNSLRDALGVCSKEHLLHGIVDECWAVGWHSDFGLMASQVNLKIPR